MNSTRQGIALPLPDDLTHYEVLICMWLGSDAPLLDAARKKFDPHPDDDTMNYDAARLEAWVCDVLYDVHYGASHGRSPDLFWVSDLGGDIAKAKALRSSISEEHLLDIDNEGWARIGAALTAKET